MITDSNIGESVYTLIELPLGDLGYDVVRIRVNKGRGSSKILQIMIENKDNREVTVKDCEKASYNISALFDVEDIIDFPYNLEVSSPGIDRPLTRLKDFEKHVGEEMKMETSMLVDGNRKFLGIIDDVEGNKIFLKLKEETEEKILSVDFDCIKKAKLVLSNKIF